MLGEEKMVCLTLVRAGPHLLAVCTQLLAVGSFVASLDDSSQKEVVTWPGPGCNMGAFFQRDASPPLCLVGGHQYDVGGFGWARPLEVVAG